MVPGANNTYHPRPGVHVHISPLDTPAVEVSPPESPDPEVIRKGQEEIVRQIMNRIFIDESENK